MLLAVTVSTAQAQRLSLRLGAASERAGRIAPVAGEQQYTGTAFTADAAVALGPASLAVRYLQGAVTDDTGARDLDLVEGEAILWVAPVRWAAVGGGPHARAYVQGGGTERWLLWEVRARAQAGLLDRRIVGYAEVWVVAGAEVDVVETFDGGKGMEGGLQFAFGRLPFSARLRYRVERLDLGDGARRETVEQLGLSVGIGRP